MIFLGQHFARSYVSTPAYFRGCPPVPMNLLRTSITHAKRHLTKHMHATIGHSDERMNRFQQNILVTHSANKTLANRHFTVKTF